MGNLGVSTSLPYLRIEPNTRNWTTCHEKSTRKLESPCGTEDDDGEFIVAWSAKPSKDHFCFEVKKSERAFVFEGGRFLGEVPEPGSYKFERKSGVSITWVWKNPFKMEYGVPKSINVVSKDGKPLGFHGEATLLVEEGEKFVNQFSRQQKVTTGTLRELVLGDIIDAFRKLIRDMNKEEFMAKRSDEMFLKEIVDRLYPLFEAYGIGITNITIMGFASDC